MFLRNTPVLSPSIFSYMFLSIYRGPWGARSPIPENNAIAISKQVSTSYLHTFTLFEESKQHTSLLCAFCPHSSCRMLDSLCFCWVWFSPLCFFQTWWISFRSSGWCMCLLLAVAMWYAFSHCWLFVVCCLLWLRYIGMYILYQFCFQHHLSLYNLPLIE